MFQQYNINDSRDIVLDRILIILDITAFVIYLY